MVMLENLNKKHKTAQHPELSGAVAQHSADFVIGSTVPGTMTSLIRPFCATPTANSVQSRAVPEIQCFGWFLYWLWGIGYTRRTTPTTYGWRWGFTFSKTISK